MLQIPIENLYIKNPVYLPAMTRISSLWSKFFQGINWNVINEQILFHLKIGFLGRTKKTKTVYSKGYKWSSWVLVFRKKTVRRKTHKKFKVNLYFSMYILNNNTRKIFFLEFSRVRSSSHRYKKLFTFISGSVGLRFIHSLWSQILKNNLFKFKR